MKDGPQRIHAVRVPDEVWDAAAAKAAANDETMSQVIRRALRAYAARPPRGRTDLKKKGTQ